MTYPRVVLPALKIVRPRMGAMVNSRIAEQSGPPDAAAQVPGALDIVKTLRRSISLRESAARAERDGVIAARAAGWPWRSIAAVIGVTGEGLRKRYGYLEARQVEPMDGEEALWDERQGAGQ